MEKLSLSIEGMSCGHCVASVKKSLAAVPGVHVDEVAIGSATVTYDAASTSVAQIEHAVSNAGYASHVATR